MPVYATRADCLTYIEGLTISDNASFDRLIDRSERDIDHAAGAWPVVDTTTGLKFDPADLPAWQTAALRRATCAQVEYRLTMGEEFMAKAQPDQMRGPDFAVVGRLPYIGPKVLRELASGGLLRSGPGVGYASISMGPASGAGGDVIGNL